MLLSFIFKAGWNVENNNSRITHKASIVLDKYMRASSHTKILQEESKTLNWTFSTIARLTR